MSAADPIDALLAMTGGAVLAPPHRGYRGGEYDGWGVEFSRHDVRRLVGAGLLSSRRGWPADVMASQFRPDLNGDEFVAWWFGQCLAGLDARRTRERTQDDDDARDSWLAIVRRELDDVAPDWFCAWLDRTQHGPKLAYLVELGAWRWLEGEEVPTPRADWGAKARAKFERRAGLVRCAA